MTLEQAFAHALQQHQAGRLPEAEALYRQILAAQPRHADALHYLGVIAHQRGQDDLAREQIRQSLTLAPNNPGAHCNLGSVYRKLGQPEEAAACFRRALELKPDYPEAHNNLGDLLREQGQFEASAASCRRAVECRPLYPEAHNNLGAALAKLGQFDQAIAAYQRALELRPNVPEIHNNLGMAQRENGQAEEAIASYHRALEFKPNYPDAHLNIGNALCQQRHFEEAIASYHHALELQPHFPEVFLSLGMALAEQGQFDEAVDAFHRALELKPDFAKACNPLGNALKDRGELDKAAAAYRRALELDPHQPMVHSNLAFLLHFLPRQDDRSIAEEHRRWNRQFTEPLRPFIRTHTNDRDPHRRLRIGYVSPDFRSHSVSYFLVPLLEAHDHTAFEIYAYASVRHSDPITERIQKSVDVWRDVRRLSDAALAEVVHRDEIDILVDLSMHTADNRLVTFAHKPAPVQVSWLAYPGGAGLETMDYRLTDTHLDPSGTEEENFGGEPIRLPDSWCCYAPVAEFPEVSPLPATENGFVTFASLNHFGKLNEELLLSWARLLAALPASRLLMICPEGQTRERVKALFATHGISHERIELVAFCPFPQFMELFPKIDIALDSFPCNGMTTTCHCLWMGAPVVTRTGATAVSRASTSLLHTIGLPEWVAQNEEEFLRIATTWANDLPRLAELRRTLRMRMQSSPLMDAPKFARYMETAYRTLWQRWCAENLSSPQ